MSLVKCYDRKDGLRWECRRIMNGKRHRVEESIRKGSWFDQSNLSIAETLKLTYWWCMDLTQSQIQQQLRLSGNTVVDWDMFCRECCDVAISKKSEKLGGENKRVQIDESKIGKRKFHHGHRVEGQWVFGGIEEYSRKCFIVAVEKRDKATLIPIIQEWIEPGTTIISDCWKAYDCLSDLGYKHESVNHSVHFVNDSGAHTNKIEGHWRQMKSSLPTHGRRKYHYASYLSEFLYRYKHRNMDIFAEFICDVAEIYNPSNPQYVTIL